MLQWDSEIDHAVAKDKFEKLRGFHDDALGSEGLQARTHVSRNKPPETGKGQKTLTSDTTEAHSKIRGGV
jgi:hypothetical protein